MLKIIKRLRYAQVNSKVIRKFLSLYYKEEKICRIPFGPLRGLKIRYNKDITFHAVLGLLDLDTFEVLLRIMKTLGLLEDSISVCDVGANIGIYSLWFSRYLDRKSRIYAFEPAPYAAERLKDNILINGIINVEIVQAACSGSSGETEFFIGYNHYASSLDKKRAAGLGSEPERIKVKSTTLDDFFYGIESREAPQLIKIDIEGGAVFALKGCNRCIEEKRPLILIESHMPEEDLAISRAIQEHDYQAFRLTNRQWVENIKDAFPNPRGVWGTLLLCPAETRKNLERIFP